MSENDWLAARFEQNRPHLKAVAYRMLGSAGDADDAVQEAWLRLTRAGDGGVANLAGWLTTTVARVCLDMRPRQLTPVASANPGRRPAPHITASPGKAGNVIASESGDGSLVR